METAPAVVAVLEAKAAALVARDGRALEALIDPAFVYVNAAGRRFDRAGYVDAFCTSGMLVFEAQRFEDVVVTDFGGFAVATMRVHDRFRHADGIFSGSFLALGVFRRDDAGWCWAAGQTMSPPDR